jgi:hypothetical protein
MSALWLLAAAALAAQSQVTGTAAGLVLNVRARSGFGAAGDSVTRANGTALGFTGSVGFRRFGLDVWYAEGTLQPADAESDRRDLVEGAIALKFAATPWLTFHVGPQIRSYTTEVGGPERWAMWQVGGRAEAAIIGSSVRGHALLWRGLGLDVNLEPGSGSSQGGEVGVTIDLPPKPFWFGLAYGIDHAQVRAAGRRETVETLTFTAGLRRR